MWTMTLYSDEATLNELSSGSALTWEGMSIDDGNLDAIVSALESEGLIVNPSEPIDFYVIKGADMNRIDRLTGDNAYPDDLNILSIPLSQLGSLAFMWRLTVGARWLDDIRDNNARREGREYEQDGEYRYY